MERFDCHITDTSVNKNVKKGGGGLSHLMLGKYHTHTLCGVLDADFRQPTKLYVSVIESAIGR